MSKSPSKKAAAHDHHDDHGADAHHGGGGHDDHGGGGHCPPPWIITFADMATLLMAFFVIMLMTATTDQPKFNAFAAVMKQTFGTIPLDDRQGRGGTSVLDLHYGPQSGEQTEDPPGTTPKSGDPDAPDAGAEGQSGEAGGAADGSAADQAAEALGKAMRDALAQGELEIQSDAGKVVVKLPEGAAPEDAQKIAEALQQAAAAQGGDATPPAQSGGGEGGSTPKAGTNGGATGTSGSNGGSAGGTSTGQAPSTDGTAPAGDAGGQNAEAGGGQGAVRAEIAAIQLGLLLNDELSAGDAKVERKDGEITLTLGSGGAFGSGSADMTEMARGIVEKLGKVSGNAKRVVVTGHTDNVPISGGEFRDNWDLASARAQSVVREIEASGVLPDAELQAVSKGESEPIADNATPEGREKNRRIEIHIEFDK